MPMPGSRQTVCWAGSPPIPTRSGPRSQGRGAAGGIAALIGRRVCVLSTGAEVHRGEVEDTNRKTLRDIFGDGYDVSFGGAVRDDQDLIAGRIRAAVEAGYGVVVTTGGVGAENKDHTIEALVKVDPQAATPYLTYFPSGHPRHVKPGIRIGVGDLHGSVIVALPGPNEEVLLAAPVLLERLRAGGRRAELAEPIAARLRAHLRTRMNHVDSQPISSQEAR